MHSSVYRSIHIPFIYIHPYTIHPCIHIHPSIHPYTVHPFICINSSIHTAISILPFINSYKSIHQYASIHPYSHIFPSFHPSIFLSLNMHPSSHHPSVHIHPCIYIRPYIHPSICIHIHPSISIQNMYELLCIHMSGFFQMLWWAISNL